MEYVIFSKLKHEYFQRLKSYLRKQLSTKLFLHPVQELWRLEVARKGAAGLGQQQETEATAGNKPSNKPHWQHFALLLS